jgi:hypothetical protein
MSGLPDFFIAGAPKCGTTALFEYLSRRPDVFMPRLKEPKFFCTDLKTRGGVYSADAYRALFAAAPRQCLTGEASTLYLYSKIAIERIMAHNPRARIIVMLRNPVDAAHSLHAAKWSHRVENMGSFENAWRAQQARLAGREMPPGCPDPSTLQYGPIYCYAAQLRRLFSHVPDDQRHVVIYEEFFAEPARHFARLLEFLQLAPATMSSFPVVNGAVGARSRHLEKLLREPPGWLKGSYTPMRPLLRAARVDPARLLWSLNAAPRHKPTLSLAFRSELVRYFAADVLELEGLLGRPLWRHAGFRVSESQSRDSVQLS